MCLYGCLCVCLSTHSLSVIHTHTHTYIQARAHTHTHTHTHTRLEDTHLLSLCRNEHVFDALQPIHNVLAYFTGLFPSHGQYDFHLILIFCYFGPTLRACLASNHTLPVSRTCARVFHRALSSSLSV